MNRIAELDNIVMYTIGMMQVLHSREQFLTSKTDILDAIHRALWAVSRRVGVRVFAADGANGQEITIARW